MMTTLFDDRERAAEYGFAHAEKLRFLAAREGVETPGAWAAAKMGIEDKGAYSLELVNSVLAGSSQADLVGRVREDLTRAGKPAAADEVSPMLVRTIADAYAKLHDIHVPAAPNVAPAVPIPSVPEHHKHGFWGWDI